MIELRWIASQHNPAAPKVLQYREVTQRFGSAVVASDWMTIPIVILPHQEYENESRKRS